MNDTALQPIFKTRISNRNLRTFCKNPKNDSFFTCSLDTGCRVERLPVTLKTELLASSATLILLVHYFPFFER